MGSSVPNIRHVVGVMTGTSIDGIDAALVRIDGRGLDMRATLVRHVSESQGELQPRLRAAADQQPMPAGEFARLAWDFGLMHASVIEGLLGGTPVDLICVHGQTVFHQPPISWQLVNPAPIAARIGCPVVSDLRQADLAHGGQGAPITPLADWILFRHESKRRAIVNLGGFCNVTILPAERAGPSSAPTKDLILEIAGFDVCACNQLLDAIARESLGAAFDEDGAAATRGRPQPYVVANLREMLDQQRRGGRSLGTGDEARQRVAAHSRTTTGEDLAASAVHAIAQTILATTEEHRVDAHILAGGGARNRALHNALRNIKGSDPFLLSVALGVPVDAREAMCFAVLGALCQDDVAITLPQVTGCSAPAPISGLWTGLIQ